VSADGKHGFIADVINNRIRRMVGREFLDTIAVEAASEMGI